MQEAWLVDGYNLLYALARRGAAPPRITTKNQLLDTLAGFSKLTGERMTVVFDGIGPDDEFAHYRNSRFEAVYSQTTAADAYIERVFTQQREHFRFKVITEDRAIADLARGTGARVYSSVEFLAEMNDNSRHANEKLLKDRVRSDRFNRPFEDKFKKFDA